MEKEIFLVSILVVFILANAVLANNTFENSTNTTLNATNITNTTIPNVTNTTNETNASNVSTPKNISISNIPYYTSRFQAVASALLSDSIGGAVTNIIYSFNDYYYCNKFDYGPFDFIFKHISVFLALYIIIGLGIRATHLLKKFSTTFKILFYFFFIPSLIILVTLLIPSLIC